ncbi:hypothetical protein, unlikely [Trypanosoma brucei gambiense DAL972]|uniref:Uncharacterized protein n=1 Tax=Trypanosoma brucei gambiense (strain MHOM/CI/86/DAL972) TaxID=679716 RepID=C9ZM04_TRYB9|nr:hypothetical protein, unlikely [Trypanosoma brucei gambiense DAL972]CBH10429.1 hypothetical protein, unlikely [Trypanosoma brucei gambiense DAL972]|eukprot:XP_011772719.1 hypothetical protein, unlikely [Trypanosoma brucei gambiense DAL972]
MIGGKEMPQTKRNKCGKMYQTQKKEHAPEYGLIKKGGRCEQLHALCICDFWYAGVLPTDRTQEGASVIKRNEKKSVPKAKGELPPFLLCLYPSPQIHTLKCRVNRRHTLEFLRV